MKIAIAAGGSGGHIYPGLTLAQALRERGHEVFFIGNTDRLEAKMIPEAGYAFKAIANKGLQGSMFDRAKAIESQFSAYRKALAILKQEKPERVIVFGGYVSVPVGLAARRLRIPLIIHEQNAFAGKANKLLDRFAQAVIISYPITKKDFHNQHILLLGNPRSSVVNMQTHSEEEFKRLALRKDLPLVLTVMGSQGSGSLNKILTQLVLRYAPEDFQLVIATGPRYYDAIHAQLPDVPSNIRVVDYVNQLQLLPYTDLIVARGGATSASEIMAYGVPSIIIPSPYVANNHQFYNAQAMFVAGAGVMLEESTLSADLLYETIERLVHDPDRLKKMHEAALSLAKPDACLQLVKVVEEGPDAVTQN